MNFPSTEFDDAVATLCHGTIGDQALQELHELLHADTSARDEYLWRVEVHGELASGGLDFGNSPACNEADDERKAITTTGLDASRTRQWLWRSTSIGLALVALVVLIAVGGKFWGSYPPQNTPVEPELVARFGELKDCRWVAPDTRAQSGDAIASGQRIELSSGSAEVLFNTGASLQLIGPTILEPRTDKSVFLTLGEVHFVSVKARSKGFTVETPTSKKSIRNNAAFTERVTPDGISHIEVSEGEVDVVMDGVANARRIKAGETLYVEPGKRKVITRIESGEGTTAFRFPTIEPPSSKDFADKQSGHATIRVVQGELKRKPGNSGSAEVLLDGRGQQRQDAPDQSAFFREGTAGSFLVDLGQAISITKINSYSWHQHYFDQTHRHRATQRFTLYGFAGDELPDLTLPPRKAGWTRIARVNSDKFFDVDEPLERPAQQACSIASARGEIGRFRYLLWVTKRTTFFGEFDIFGSPESETASSAKGE